MAKWDWISILGNGARNWLVFETGNSSSSTRSTSAFLPSFTRDHRPVATASSGWYPPPTHVHTTGVFLWNSHVTSIKKMQRSTLQCRFIQTRFQTRFAGSFFSCHFLYLPFPLKCLLFCDRHVPGQAYDPPFFGRPRRTRTQCSLVIRAVCRWIWREVPLRASHAPRARRYHLCHYWSCFLPRQRGQFVPGEHPYRYVSLSWHWKATSVVLFVFSCSCGAEIRFQWPSTVSVFDTASSIFFSFLFLFILPLLCCLSFIIGILHPSWHVSSEI